MPKLFKFTFLSALVIVLVASFFLRNPETSSNQSYLDAKPKTKIAIIFDDLGESLSDLEQIYQLNIPLTISIIPGLAFSKNIAHIGARSGFTVMIHLPLEPKNTNRHQNDKYDFLSSSLPKNQINRLLNNYLNSIRIATGVNNHMGSKATEDYQLMSHILERIKRRNLFFIDSRTSPDSIAYKVATEKGVRSAYNHAFLDAKDDPEHMRKKIDNLLEKKSGEKLIIIVHPKKNTFLFFQENLDYLKKNIEFITIENYLNLKYSHEQ